MTLNSSLFKKYEGLEFKKTRRTERGDLIEAFLSKLNPERKVKNIKPLSFSFMSMYFSQRKMTIPQMYQFYRDCERARNFGSYFWYATSSKFFMKNGIANKKD